MASSNLTRREFLQNVGLGAACLASRGFAQDAPAMPAHPNLIMLLCDDLGYGDLGCYGNPIVKSPNLDRFAAEGIRFTSFYAAAPNCSPSRAGLLTGRTPYRVGMYDVIGKNSFMLKLPTTEMTIAKILTSVGYDTCHFGKWHLSPIPTASDGKSKPSDIVPHGFRHSFPSKITATETVRVFSSWLAGRQDATQPFFAYFGLHESHEPVDQWSPAAYRQLYNHLPNAPVPNGDVEHSKTKPSDRRVYYGCISQLDDAFEALIRTLEARGLRENTIVMFTSDNGPDDRCRYAFGSPGSFRGSKGRLYEGGIRVPALLQWPSRFKGGAVIDEPISFTDILPTICGIIGTPPPCDRTIDGVDFRPSLSGQELCRVNPLYWGMWAARGGAQYAIRDGDWKLLARTEPLPKNIPVIEHIKKGKIIGYELYNLRKDPGESHEASEEEPQVLKTMVDRFTRIHREVLAEGPIVELEEHRKKARWAWPSDDDLNPTSDDMAED